MYAAGPSSPAWATARRPSARAFANTRCELARRVAALAGVEADADELAAERQRRVERRERVLLGEVAQEAQDQVASVMP